MRYLKAVPFCSGMVFKIKETEYIRIKSSSKILDHNWAEDTV